MDFKTNANIKCLGCFFYAWDNESQYCTHTLLATGPKLTDPDSVCANWTNKDDVSDTLKARMDPE